MSYGLVDVQRSIDRSAMQGIGHAAAMEQNREIHADQMKQAEKAQKMSNIGTGAAIGASVGGPWGAAIGAGAGLLVSLF